LRRIGDDDHRLVHGLSDGFARHAALHFGELGAGQAQPGGAPDRGGVLVTATW
jgi:hypothetical protein